jgi:hypothetical protein
MAVVNARAGRGIMSVMPEDDPSEKDTSLEATPIPAGPLPAIFEDLAPVPVEPEMLLEGLRYLQQRIPGFEQLSVAEERSMARAAHLDREAIDSGLHAAGAWDESKVIIGYSAEELRRMDEEIRKWDSVEREMSATMKGLAGAILRRRHVLGIAILDLYSTLRRSVKRPNSPRARLRPHLEDMRRAFGRKKGKKRGGESE